MINIWQEIKDGRVRINKDGDLIYHTCERMGNGFTGHDVNISEESRRYGMKIEESIAFHKEMDYDPFKDTIGSD